MSKYIFLQICFIFTSNSLVANEVPVIFPYQQDKDNIKNASRWYIPTIISEEAKIVIKNKKQKIQDKINKNFTKEEKIVKAKKVKTEIKIDDSGADFFNSLSEEKSIPMNIE